MLELAFGALFVGIVAWLLGFTGIAGLSFAVAKIIAIVFVAIFLVLAGVAVLIL